MSMTMSNTKAELLAAYTALCADAQAQRHAIKELREQLCMAQSAPTLPLGKATHTAYYAYVRQCRDVAKQRGLRVATYKTFDAWSAS